jgi:ATP-dependent helicase/nuclease subunit B
MQAWADNLAMAFAEEVLPLRDWLPILEAGLSALTVGVVPPALDQVLVGAVDRSRNPELRLAIVMGLNEGRFPAPPPPPTMLTEAETAALERQGVSLGTRARLRIAHERYLGYIAFTRSGERVLGTFPSADAEGRALNPSPFVGHLQRLFPDLACEAAPAWNDWRQALHVHELAPEWLRPGSVLNTVDRDADGKLQRDSPFEPLAAGLEALRQFRDQPELTAAGAARLYGNPLRLSVSSLEQFGMCPFRFFVRAGLRAEERQLYETDPRELGNFQHEVLSAFHEQLRSEGLRWRDVTPAEARGRIAAIAPRVAHHLRGGLFESGAANQFTCRALTEALQEFVAAIVGWMPQYAFDPAEAELGFGGGGPDLPPWTLSLDPEHSLAFRGRIDRVDVSEPLADGTRWVTVHDYKSSGRQFDPELLANGIQLQLPAYLAVLRGVAGGAARLGAQALRPAGVFYVNLRGDYPGVSRREDALEDPEAARRRAYRHIGRFDAAAIPVLDTRGGRQGDQFNYEIRQDGGLSRRRKDPMPSAEFNAMLQHVEEQLITMGREVLAGRVEVNPYARGSERPCDLCDFAGICRINPWTHRFRALRPPGAPVPAA